LALDRLSEPTPVLVEGVSDLHDALYDSAR